MRYNSVFDYLKYLEKRTFKGHALYIPLPKEDEKKKVLLHFLSSFEQTYQTKLFFLSEGDSVAFFAHNKLQDMMLLSLKLKGLEKSFFQEHKLSFFNLITDFNALIHKINHQELTPTADFSDLKVLQKIPSLPLDTPTLTHILSELKTADVSHLTRHQCICQVHDLTEMVPVFTSVFCKDIDVRQVLFPKVILDSDTYLKRAFKNALYTKILKKELPKTQGGVFSASPYLLTQPVYQEMHQLYQHQGISYEISLSDFLWERDLWQSIQKIPCYQQSLFLLRIPEEISYLAWDKIPMHYLKINSQQMKWAATLNYPKEKIILFDIQTPQEIQQAQALGFSLMQGSEITRILHGNMLT